MRACLSVAATFAPTLPTTALDQAGMTRIAEERQAAASDPLLYQGRVPLLLLATSVTTAHANWTCYPTWQAPTLVLHGTADTATDPAGSRRFFETIASPDKTLHIVEGGHHELLNDTERDETLRVLLTWLERRLPPT